MTSGIRKQRAFCDSHTLQPMVAAAAAIFVSWRMGAGSMTAILGIQHLHIPFGFPVIGKIFDLCRFPEMEEFQTRRDNEALAIMQPC